MSFGIGQESVRLALRFQQTVDLVAAMADISHDEARVAADAFLAAVVNPTVRDPADIGALEIVEWMRPVAQWRSS